MMTVSAAAETIQRLDQRAKPPHALKQLPLSSLTFSSKISLDYSKNMWRDWKSSVYFYWCFDQPWIVLQAVSSGYLTWFKKKSGTLVFFRCFDRGVITFVDTENCSNTAEEDVKHCKHFTFSLSLTTFWQWSIVDSHHINQALCLMFLHVCFNTRKIRFKEDRESKSVFTSSFPHSLIQEHTHLRFI